MAYDWEDLRLFLAAYRHGSLTKAAAALGLGQATLSRRVAALEAAVGHPLFERGRGGLTATEAGLALLPHAETMEGAAREAEASLQGLEAAAEGRVRVAVAPGMAVDFFPRVLPELLRRHPKIQLDLLADNRALDLGRHEADVAFRAVPPETGDLLVRKLLSTPLGLYASPEYVRRHPRRRRLDQLDYLGWSDELAHMGLAVFLEQIRGKPYVLTTNNFLAMRAAAQAGLGVMLLPGVQAQLAGLVPVPTARFDAPIAPLYLVWPRALRGVPRVVAVVELILAGIERLGRHGDDWPDGWSEPERP